MQGDRYRKNDITPNKTCQTFNGDSSIRKGKKSVPSTRQFVYNTQYPTFFIMAKKLESIVFLRHG